MDKASVATVGIVGVSGYSGMELARIVAGHPQLALALAISDKWAGTTLADHLPIPSAGGALVVRPQKEATAAAFAGLEIVFLCTPAEASIALAPVALEAGARVVDLSGAFRLPANEYPRWYGFTHAQADLLPTACYSMPEAGASGDIRSARLVSNPGCYATAGALAVLALLRGAIISPDGIVIDAAGGTTGAGRKASEDFSCSEVDGDFRASRVLRRQHTPEIERALGLA